MKKSALFINLFLSLLVGTFISFGVQNTSGEYINPFVPAVVIFILGMALPSMKGTLAMGLNVEMWIPDIQENLFQQGQFILLSQDHSGYVNKKTVHMPQAGSKPSVLVNPTVYPLVVSTRTDTDFTYDLDNYVIPPTLITVDEQQFLSYDKRMSVLGDQIKTLSETIANYVAYKWALNASVANSRTILTSGTANTGSLGPGCTGTRKEIILKDITRLANLLDNDNMPVGDERYLLMPNNMFWELFGISEVVRASYNGFQAQPSTVASGVVAQFMGFNIMKRTGVNMYTSSQIIKAVGAASAATDEQGCLAWTKSAVARAEGAIEAYSDSGDTGKGKPEYQGSLVSANVFMGAQVMRADYKGVAALIQAT